MLMRMGGLVLLTVTFASAARADAILDKPSFTATPKELLSLAAKASSTRATVILREEEDASIDAQNRQTLRFRRVFVVTSQAGVDDWGTFQWSWKPFHQEKPQLRARVIDPKGNVAELDQKLVTDAPEKSSPSVFSDRRTLEAPLPRLTIGAVVEEELILKDRQPILSAGALTWNVLGADVQTESTKVTISTPARKGKLFTVGLPAKTAPKYAISGDRETWTYELGPLAPSDDRESLEPRDANLPPMIGVSTSSWQVLAREYRKVLDKRIADGAIELPADLPRTASLDTIKAISAWLHRNVRYTGIEFDEASHIPWTPAETVKRGFGDCKDKATLLIALLRKAGITADLALLSTGPGIDVIPQLPGMSVFDHAIVRARLAGRDIWIDATEDLLVPGQLPSRDQERRAFVIADDTTGLVDTPRASPTDNLVREVRTFELSESGAAKRVTETSTFAGVFEADERDWIRGANREDLEKDLASYMESEYAGTFTKITNTPPDDLSKPFELSIEATDVNRAYTERGHIDVYLYATDALDKVPAVLKEQDKQNPRKHELAWYRPHVFEIENRLVVPQGYTMPTVPAERIHALGAARVIERQRVDGRTLIVTFRFESGKQRLTAAEVETMRSEIAALGNMKTHIVIEHTGWSLAERGKVKEAIAEVQKLIALHPREALHHTELAFVMIRAGMGEAARRAAREAVKVEPANADAHVVLGWTLRHDTIGREFSYDFDRAGAIAAFQKARKLDPKHLGAVTGHAEILERDADGVMFGKTADIKGAAEAWATALKLDDTQDQYALSLARALLFSRQFAEIETVLAKRKPADAQDAIRVAAVAASTNANEAIALAGRLRAGNARSTLITSAAQLTVVLGNYDAARALFAETNAGATRGAMALLLQKVKRHDPSAIPDSDPRKPLEDIPPMIIDDRYRPRYMWDAQTAKEADLAAETRTPELMALRGRGAQFLEDVLHTVMETRVEGKGPWRVEVDAMGHRGMYYAALDQKTAKQIGGAEHPQGVGRHIFRLLARNDVASATTLLDWLANDAPSHPAVLDWKASARDKDAIALAAALLARDTDAARATPVLVRCAGTAERRERCDAALATIFSSEKKWRELEQHTGEWLKRSTDARHAKAMRMLVLAKLGRFDEADQVIDEKQLEEISLALSHAEVAISRGAIDEAIKRYERIAKREPRAFNEVAWLIVVNDRDFDRGYELAAKVVGPEKAKAASPPLNTLAVLEAETGRLAEAKQDMWQSIGNRRGSRPEDQDWYVVGRIAEQLGLRDDAIAAYKKCTAKPSDDPRSLSALAKRRLQRMGAKL